MRIKEGVKQNLHNVDKTINTMASTHDQKDYLLEVKELVKFFTVHNAKGKKVQLYAVDNVSFGIHKGETFGLVGESGCGKSTLGRTILNLYPSNSGEIIFEKKNTTRMKRSEQKAFSREAQLIFQDPAACLNPRNTIGEILQEPYRIHKFGGNENERKKSICELLSLVGLSTDYYDRYPHEMSGGQKQRIGIARALSLKPKLIVCDEPVSALDVSIQAQVVNLLEDLQTQFDLTYLFISHDLGVVYHICSRVGVMYLGRMVELADKEPLYNNTLHPYTQALISAIPGADAQRKRIVLSGDVPSPSNIPPGCRFHTRCPKAMEICKKEDPKTKMVEKDHWVACHLY